MKKSVFLIAILALANLSFAGIQLNIDVGDTVDARLASGLVNPKVGGIEVNLNGTTIGYDVGDDAVWAGSYLIDIDGIASSYKSFCMDVTKDPIRSFTTHTVYGAGSDIEDMWATYYEEVISDAVEAAAFQLAVWEMVHETSSYDIASGDFYLENLNESSPNNNGATFTDLTNLANTYLNSNNWTGSAQLALLDDGTHQPFVVETPEPATLAFLAFGGIALLGRRKHT